MSSYQFDGDFEVRSIRAGGEIEGLLAGYGNVDRHNEIIDRQAFSRSLDDRKGRALPMLLHHDVHRPVGAWKEWQERSEGLYVKGEIAVDTRDGAEAHTLVKQGALTGLSIGFLTKKSRADQDGRRCHVEVDLVEGSLVSVPSNPITHVTSIKEIGSARDIADAFREMGLSSRRAKAAAGAAWRTLNETDVGDEEVAAILNASAARIASIGVRK